MKFIIDENLSYKLVGLLNHFGHSAIHIREIQISLKDLNILELALERGTLVLTADKDFGELIFRDSQHHWGVIFLRLDDQTLSNTKRALNWLFSTYSEEKFKDNFITVTEKEGRFKARFSSFAGSVGE